MLHLRPISTVVPSHLTSRASCVEAGLAGDRVVVHMEVAVVDHVVAFVVIRWTVDRPEAGVRANPTCLPEAICHHQQGRIDFNTVPSLSTGKDFLIHSLEKN